jgi:hypothetical protein
MGKGSVETPGPLLLSRMDDIRVGDRVRNKKFGWVGVVRHVECLACGHPVVDGVPQCRHKALPACICFTVEQAGVFKPWCSLTYFEKVYTPPTVWEWILENPLDVADWHS